MLIALLLLALAVILDLALFELMFSVPHIASLVVWLFSRVAYIAAGVLAFA